MATIEGPLSKWTNVMQGWQYRWFVLDDTAAILSYYTSKEKMKKGSRRGCVRLKEKAKVFDSFQGAVLGINDEDDSTFTITTRDQKTFHFQARDGEERQKWMEALENIISSAESSNLMKKGKKPVPTSADLDRKLMETDAYLQILIDQVKAVEQMIDTCEDEASKVQYNLIKLTADQMIESVKHAIVMMQLAKPHPSDDAGIDLRGSQSSLASAASAEVPDFHTHKLREVARKPLTHRSSSQNNTEVCHKAGLSHDVNGAGVAQSEAVNNEDDRNEKEDIPLNSYSSSDDDDFFDADEGSSPAVARAAKHKANNDDQVLDERREMPEVIASKNDVFDELYDGGEEDQLESLDAHGSIIKHLLSQVRIGMDLTKIVLPTFILERRSLLEMFADFFSHPDLFVRIGDFSTPEERITEVIRWYMSAFHAGRKSSVAKKPYNPILGETFQCFWDVPGLTNDAILANSGPVKWASKSNLCYIAEQVSHHPPISAFYAECQDKKISLDGYIWTKSKFLGLSIGVHMVGQAVITLHDHDEEYRITFPSGYGRSILTVPWIELGGKCTVACDKTGYSGQIDFITKPFYGGKKHQIKGQVLEPNNSKPTCTIQGEWNGVMWAQYSTGRNEIFCDTTKAAIMKKRVQPISEQDEFESRRLWSKVTINLKNKDVVEATKYKQQLEQRQREEAKQRAETGAKIKYKYFQEVGEHWVYKDPLLNRLSNGTPNNLADGDRETKPALVE